MRGQPHGGPYTYSDCPERNLRLRNSPTATRTRAKASRPICRPRETPWTQATPMPITTPEMTSIIPIVSRVLSFGRFARISLPPEMEVAET